MTSKQTRALGIALVLLVGSVLLLVIIMPSALGIPTMPTPGPTVLPPASTSMVPPETWTPIPAVPQMIQRPTFPDIFYRKGKVSVVYGNGEEVVAVRGTLDDDHNFFCFAHADKVSRGTSGKVMFLIDFENQKSPSCFFTPN